MKFNACLMIFRVPLFLFLGVGKKAQIIDYDIALND